MGLGVFPGNEVSFVGGLIWHGRKVYLEFDSFGFANAIDDHAAARTVSERNVDVEGLKNQ